MLMTCKIPNEEKFEQCFTEGRRRLTQYGGTPLDLSVYLEHLAHRNYDTMECWPSQDTVAKAIGVQVRAVRKSIKFLIKVGLMVFIYKTQRGSNHYRIRDLNSLPLLEKEPDNANQVTSPRYKKPKNPNKQILNADGDPITFPCIPEKSHLKAEWRLTRSDVSELSINCGTPNDKVIMLCNNALKSYKKFLDSEGTSKRFTPSGIKKFLESYVKEKAHKK